MYIPLDGSFSSYPYVKAFLGISNTSYQTRLIPQYPSSPKPCCCYSTFTPLFPTSMTLLISFIPLFVFVESVITVPCSSKVYVLSRRKGYPPFLSCTRGFLKKVYFVRRRSTTFSRSPSGLSSTGLSSTGLSSTGLSSTGSFTGWHLL